VGAAGHADRTVGQLPESGSSSPPGPVTEPSSRFTCTVPHRPERPTAGPAQRSRPSHPGSVYQNPHQTDRPRKTVSHAMHSIGEPSGGLLPCPAEARQFGCQVQTVANLVIVLVTASSVGGPVAEDGKPGRWQTLIQMIGAFAAMIAALVAVFAYAVSTPHDFNNWLSSSTGPGRAPPRLGHPCRWSNCWSALICCAFNEDVLDRGCRGSTPSRSRHPKLSAAEDAGGTRSGAARRLHRARPRAA
jgi:hypothetical protein